MMKHINNNTRQLPLMLKPRRADASRTSMFICFIITFALLASSCESARRGETNTANANLDTYSPTTTMSANMNGNTNSTATLGRMVGMDAPEEKTTRGESYAHRDENPFRDARREPLSTFSVDVDTASYSNVRRFINEGSLPPKDAVRVEEFINYFTYDYPQPAGNAPFSVVTESASCPWNPRHKLVSVGLQGRRVQSENLPPANLVFLVAPRFHRLGR